MYCPNCGQTNADEQNFCRRCGLNLEKIGESLEMQRVVGGIEPSDRRLELFGNVAFGGLGVVGFFAVTAMIFVVIQRFVLAGQNIFFGIAISLFLVFAMMAIMYVVLNESRKEKQAGKRPMATPPNPPALDTAKLLVDRPFEPVASVVEDTTDLLKVGSHTRERKWD